MTLSTAHGSASLSRGDKGEAVRELQRLLTVHGYYTGPASGAFDDAVWGSLVYFQQTAIGPDKKVLAVTGSADASTWWALRSSVDDQRAGLPRQDDQHLSEKRLKIIATAERYHGVCENPIGSNHGPQVDLWTGNDDRSKTGPAWCSFFMSAIWHEVLGYYPLGGRIGLCTRSVELAKTRGYWHDGAVLPCPGDQFVMLYEGEREGRGHTGLVTGVEVDRMVLATLVSTIEGNCGHRVARRVREVSTIAGWIDPIRLPRSFRPGLTAGVAAAANEPTV